jgi:hypothetical protein
MTLKYVSNILNKLGIFVNYSFIHVEHGNLDHGVVLLELSA